MTANEGRNGDLPTQTESVSAEEVAPEVQPVVAATVLWHPDLDRVGHRAVLPGLISGREERLSRLEPRFAPADGRSSASPLGDPRLSRRPIHLRPLEGGGVEIESAKTEIRIPASAEPGGLATTPFRASEGGLDRGVVLMLARRVVLLLHRFHPVSPVPPAFGLVGQSAELDRARLTVERVAPLAYPVLVRGETGTGKELVARALHRASERSQGPFVALDLGAVSPSLAVAELFGAERGAFTGAHRNREGHWARAEGGTLFLDEIGAASLEVQAALLRALETSRMQPVGGGPTRKVDVRVVAATDTALESAIAEGRFLQPLYHRLAGCEILLPPLRDRREDIGLLLRHFLRIELDSLGAAARLDGLWLRATDVGRLAMAAWPGNVRHLRNVARQLALAGAGGDRSTIPDSVERQLGMRAPGHRSSTSAEAPGPEGSRAVVDSEIGRRHRHPDDVSDAELLDRLAEHRYNLRRTARALGVSRSTLYGLVERCPDARKASDLQPDELRAALEATGGRIDAMVDRLRVSKRGLVLRLRELGLDRST